MGIQPSASRTALLLLCPRPFDPEIEADPDLPGEPARYGSAFHQVIASCLRSSEKKPLEGNAGPYAKAIDKAAREYDVRGARDELAGHVKSNVRVLRNWLKREKLEVAEIEKAYAIRPFIPPVIELVKEPRPPLRSLWKAREVPPHDEDHHYDIESDELGATVDLIVRSANRKRLVVIDHKTGGGEFDKFAQPASMPQMKTLGLVANKAPSVELGIFHADRRGLPAMYAEPYELEDQTRHSAELYTAMARIGHGFLRPGAHCDRCHARNTCPAKAADLLSESTAALVGSATKLAVEPIAGLLAPETGASIEVRAGALYDLLRKFKPLADAGWEEIKKLIKAGVVIESRDGKVLTVQKQTYEMLSKKSVIEAFGKVQGEKELARLRKKGAVRETSREMIKGE